MLNFNVEGKWRSPKVIIAMGIGAGLVTAGLAYHWFSGRAAQPISVAVPRIEQVSALGRLEPQGEVIRVFAPTALDGARVETLNVEHGQQIRKGDVIAVLDTHTRRLAAVQEAQEQVSVAQAQLSQVEAGAKSGQIQAQASVVDRQQVELQTETMAQAATVARLEAELRNAKLEDQRYQALYISGAVSASLRDGKQLTADTVQQQLNEARVNLSRIQQSRQQQVSEAQATLDQIAEVRPVDVNVARSQVAKAQGNPSAGANRTRFGNGAIAPSWTGT